MICSTPFFLFFLLSFSCCTACKLASFRVSKSIWHNLLNTIFLLSFSCSTACKLASFRAGAWAAKTFIKEQPKEQPRNKNIKTKHNELKYLRKSHEPGNKEKFYSTLHHDHDCLSLSRMHAFFLANNAARVTVSWQSHATTLQPLN